MALIPFFHAVKTKLGPAKTFNMVASDVFLYWVLAWGAFSGIFCHPILINVLFIRKLLPLLYLLASCRFMGLFFTSKTVDGSTWALYVVLLNIHRFLTKILAILWWAITYRIIDYSVVNTNFLSIQLCYFYWQLLNKMQQYWVSVKVPMHAGYKNFILY